MLGFPDSEDCKEKKEANNSLSGALRSTLMDEDKDGKNCFILGYEYDSPRAVEMLIHFAMDTVDAGVTMGEEAADE